MLWINSSIDKQINIELKFDLVATFHIKWRSNDSDHVDKSLFCQFQTLLVILPICRQMVAYENCPVSTVYLDLWFKYCTSTWNKVPCVLAENTLNACPTPRFVENFVWEKSNSYCFWNSQSFSEALNKFPKWQKWKNLDSKRIGR